MRERLLLITDRRLAPVEAVIAAALAALPAWGTLVLLREKDLGGRALFELAERVARLCDGRARLVVSDRADVAAAVGAGVHLPELGLSVAEARGLVTLVGASIHAPRATGADYVMLGPVFETPGKGPPIGLDGLTATGEPVFAVGGIEGPLHAAAAVAAGAHGVAVIRAVMAAVDPGAAAAALYEAVSAPRT